MNQVLSKRSRLVSLLVATLLSAQLHAREPVALDIPAQPLSEALRQLGTSSNTNIIFEPGMVRGMMAPAVKGNITTQEALLKLLDGTPWSFKFVDENTVSLVPAVEKNAGAENTHNNPHEEIVVTGTHIRGVEPVGAAVTVLDRQQIASSGHSRLQDLLAQLPQNFSGSTSEVAGTTNFDQTSGNFNHGQGIDLRGLGASSTLVLINGRRQAAGGLRGSFVDISSVATSAVERVEILADGASALYGSDAIGGVVNVVLRKDYEGAETGVRLTTTDGAREEKQINQLFGRRWSSGNVLLGYQYYDRDPLMAADASFSSLGHDFRSLGGSDRRGTYGGTPGQILINFQPAYAIPSGQDGRQLTFAELLPGVVNYADTVTGVSVLGEQRQHAMFFSLSQAVTSKLELFAEGRASRRRSEWLGGGSTFSARVPSSNPFYVDVGTGPATTVAYSFGKELGVSTSAFATDTASLNVGGAVLLGEGWKLTTSLSYARERNTMDQNNLINPVTLNAALADTDPSTALNLFGDGSANNPATLDTLRSKYIDRGLSKIKSINVIADGTLFTAPAGPVRLAVGADYRDESYNQYFGRINAGVFQPFATRVGNIERNVGAVFAELAVPLAATDSGSPLLELALAGRYEDYSDFGSTTDPKIGVNFRPLKGLKLRTSAGTSFRAPRYNEFSQTANQPNAFPMTVMDPRSPTGQSTVLYMTGANPDLGPETARTWTAGFDFVPAFDPGLSVSASYFDIRYDDKITPGGAYENTLALEYLWAPIITRNPTPQQVVDICSAGIYAANNCPADPSSINAIVDGRIRNLSRIHTNGIDLDVNRSAPLAWGRLALGLSGTYVLTYDQQVTAVAPAFDVANTVGNVPRLRLRGRAGWSLNGWSANAFVNYLDGGRDTINNVNVDSWTTLDGSLGYTLNPDGPLGGATIQLSVINLLDEKPPFVNNFSGYDSSNANEFGRSVGLSLTKTW